LLGQDLVEGDGGHGGHGHALTVDRVERAAGVADDDEAFRPPAQPLEMPSLVVGVAVAEDRRHRLGSLDGLVEQGAAQATSEVVEAEQQIPLGGGEGPEVRQVGVPTQLHPEPSHRSVVQVGGRRPSGVTVRRRLVPRLPTPRPPLLDAQVHDLSRSHPPAPPRHGAVHRICQGFRVFGQLASP
jgi:hypothetical protein